MRDTIPKKFYHVSESTPSAKTVGELIAVLQELPSDMPLDARKENEEVIWVSVYNVNDDATRSVEFEDERF